MSNTITVFCVNAWQTQFSQLSDCGALSLTHTLAHSHSLDTTRAQNLLESMAVSAGILLRKSQLLSHAVAAQRKSNALMRLVKLDSSNSTMEEAIDGIVKIAYSILDADRVSGMWALRMGQGGNTRASSVFQFHSVCNHSFSSMVSESNSRSFEV